MMTPLEIKKALQAITTSVGPKANINLCIDSDEPDEWSPNLMFAVFTFEYGVMGSDYFIERADTFEEIIENIKKRLAGWAEEKRISEEKRDKVEQKQESDGEQIPF